MTAPRYGKKPPLAKRIFVFDTDLLGEHKTDAAITAHRFHGAARGTGFGLAGNSFAIPTMSIYGTPLSLFQISLWVSKFLTYAAEHKELQFDVGEIGCDATSYEPEEVAPFFVGHTRNVTLSKSFQAVLRELARTVEPSEPSTTTVVTENEP